MRRLTALVLVIALGGTFASAQNNLSSERDDYVSEASFVLGTYQPNVTDRSPQAMAAAGNRFLDSLDDPIRDRAAHPLDSPERRLWTNLPADPQAGGVPLGKLNEAQIKAVCDLMGTLLSEQGYDKLRNIMLADDQLLEGGRPRRGFGTETFAVVVFGSPSATEPWAFQIDGHHIGVNVAVSGAAVTLSPSFIGTQPESFRIGNGPRIRPLAGEIDDAFDLATSLSEDQFKQALVDPRRGQIVTGPGRDASIPEPQGISCATLDDAQKKILRSLISRWVGNLPVEHAERRMKQLEGEIDKMYFAWYGPRRPEGDVSYMLQGPSLIIEYACQDLGGNPPDHLHTMYRDPTNEYGKQLTDGK